MTSDLSEKSCYYLEPGYIYCSREQAQLQTVLGSCVAVCLWDEKLKFGGMNHFLLPSTRDPEKATAQYGNVATVELVKMMEKAGSRRHDMRAQILGGAVPPGLGGPDIGRENTEVARALLKRRAIQVLSEDTGGNMGRKVVFDTGTGHLMVLKVHQLRETDWMTTGY
jgi:chemotaxis protein CheD